MADRRTKTVFISCGQCTETEKAMGNEVRALVKELTPFEPYLAEDQTSLDGLTQNTFRALNDCIGLIAVMHHRGAVSTPDGDIVRGSVWIEQEIAIVAFLQNSLGRDIRVRLYLQKGIAREGLRDKLILNPVEFETKDEILHHLRLILPQWEDSMKSGLCLQIDHRREPGSGRARLYRFSVTLKNRSPKIIREYTVEARFPLAFRTPTHHGRRVQNDGEPGVDLYRVNQNDGPWGPIYPDHPVEVLSFDYRIDGDDAAQRNLLSEQSVVRLFSGDNLVDENRVPMSELLD